MRLAVYAIMKNEAGHLARWLDGLLAELEAADTITLLDTGSDDGTLALAYEYEERFPEVRVLRASITPWRFDDARNAALALTPADADAAWSLDLDEFPQPGWRDAIDAAWHEELDRLRYKFVWSFQPDGSEGVTFFADKLHARTGFRWKGIAHEWLVLDAATYGPEEHALATGLVVHHHQDASIDRAGRDLALMERAIQELPDDERLQHYYARQLYFAGRMVEASEAFQAHLANPKATWRHERSQSMIYLSKLGGNEAWDRQWLMRAAAECPERREVWWELAKFEAGHQPALALAYLERLERTPADVYYLSDPEARGDAPAKLRLELQRQLLEVNGG